MHILLQSADICLVLLIADTCLDTCCLTVCDENEVWLVSSAWSVIKCITNDYLENIHTWGCPIIQVICGMEIQSWIAFSKTKFFFKGTTWKISLLSFVLYCICMWSRWLFHFQNFHLFPVPPSFIHFANIISIFSILASKSLIKILNSTGPEQFPLEIHLPAWHQSMYSYSFLAVVQPISQPPKNGSV